MPPIPFHQPEITDEEINEVIGVLRSGWITTGQKVKQFENDFAQYVGAQHAVALNSCTAALHLALEAIGLEAGDEVITTPMTFAATAEVVRYFNARPVFVDIAPDTMNIDVTKVEEKVAQLQAGKRKLKAIIPVHYGGHPCDMDRVLEIAREARLKVIEDAAHAFPCRFHEKMVGTIGDITCFSFYATKTITTGEGGMITTDCAEYAERARIMSLHGISKDALQRYTMEGSWYYEIIAPGYKYNMSDIMAGLGIAQLKKADVFRNRREDIARRYTRAFQNLAQITPPVVNSDSVPSWHLYPIKLNLPALTIDRNRFIEELKARGIGTSVHFIPLHIHPYYREKYGYQPEDFPVAYQTYQRIISLPIYPRMTDTDTDQVIGAVIDIATRYKA